MKRLKNNLMVYKHKLIIENSQEMMIFFDVEGKITDCNANAINELGYGEDIYQIRIHEIFKKAFQYKYNQLETNMRYHSNPEETTAYRKNQTCFPVELKIEIINDNDLYIGLCTAINISAKKERNHEVKHLRNDIDSYSQINSEFTANITHELRTPVNGIMGLTNNLLRTELNQDQRYDVNLIKICCNNMNTIINDLLDYAKISNDKLILEQREFSFHSFINHIIEQNKKGVNEKGLQLFVNISKDIPERVIGDEFRLSQILNNLFSNAIKFTLSGHVALEVIKISQSIQSLELFFVMMDSGIGIGLDERDKLFKSFSQVDGSISRRFGGTGLGLSICKKLIEAMHGTISVDSEKNKGSTFSFSVCLGVPQFIEGGASIFATDEFLLNLENSKTVKADSEYNNSLNSNKDALKNMSLALEKMTICIEMENWNKAEELAIYVKNLAPADHSEIKKNFFRLLLAVRKENRDDSLELLNILKATMEEVM